MAKCKLVLDQQTLDGMTFYSKEGCMRQTGVFVPRIEGLSYTPDVILWLHGWYVDSPKDCFQPAKRYETNLRESVIASKRNVILVVPWLGKQTHRGEGTLKIGDLGQSTNLKRYLEEVLAAMTQWVVDTLIAGEIAQSGRPPDYQVGNLVIACHSGGGDLMRIATGALGSLSENLRECWGFDCLYASGTTYNNWAVSMSSKGVKSYFYLADGSSGVHFAEFWKASFGTPQAPKPGGGLKNLYLAPAVPGCEVDSTAFQSMEAITAKPDATNPFDVVRRKTDPYLGEPATYSNKISREALKGHFQVVRELFTPRLVRSGLGS